MSMFICIFVRQKYSLVNVQTQVNVLHIDLSTIVKGDCIWNHIAALTFKIEKILCFLRIKLDIILCFFHCSVG